MKDIIVQFYHFPFGAYLYAVHSLLDKYIQFGAYICIRLECNSNKFAAKCGATLLLRNRLNVILVCMRVQCKLYPQLLHCSHNAISYIFHHIVFTQ